MNDNKIQPKKIKILGYFIKVNQAWYITLMISVVLNFGWNFKNNLKNDKLELLIENQHIVIEDLKKTNRELKLAYDALLDNMVLYNRSFEDFPLPVANKVKRGLNFYSNYYNIEYEREYFLKNNTNRYENVGRTDFNNAPFHIAKVWYDNDLEVALTGEKKVYSEPFLDSLNRMGRRKYFKWRKLRELDTLVYMMELPKY